MISGAAVVHLSINALSATERLAEACASVAAPGFPFLLSGGLGAGKSTFARAFIRHLIGADEEVPSPTFTLVQHYGLCESGDKELEIWHADLYRLSDPEEVLELGLDDAFAEAICLVEWPDRLGALTPKDAIELIFRFAADKGADAREIDVRIPLTYRAAFAAACAKIGIEVHETDERTELY